MQQAARCALRAAQHSAAAAAHPVGFPGVGGELPLKLLAGVLNLRHPLLQLPLPELQVKPLGWHVP